MRVLVTGAGGNLGRCVVPVLAGAGHQLRLLDFRTLQTDHESVQGDVRDGDAVAEAIAGMDAVVHGAALHGIHLGTWSERDFWSINADGTFTVYDAARKAGIGRIVLASSMAVYGVGAGHRNHWQVITEESPCRPNDLYGLTKVVAEDTARFHSAAHQITTVALRLGMFVPETFERYGFRLLFGGVDDREVAQAVALALSHEPAGGFAAYNIMADNGLTAAEVGDLSSNLIATLERHWPITEHLLAEKQANLDDLVWGGALYRIDRARNELGYQPTYDFTGFLDAWRRGDSQYYPFAHHDWWGAQRPSP